MSTSAGHDTHASSDDEPGNHISVVLRTRPLSFVESQRKESSCLRFPGDGEVEIEWSGMRKFFRFNVAFEGIANQREVFDHCGIKRLVDLTMDGYACTCFAYGQTGSGKTHTITGPSSEFFLTNHPNPDLYGIMPRSFRYLFSLIKEHTGRNFRVHASYFELYNEQIVDLLNPNTDFPLNLRWQKSRGFYVENLYLIECETAGDLMSVLETGMKNRAFTSTTPNEFSSRSHSIFTILVDGERPDSEDDSLVFTKHGKLTFVDLAGSEKVKDGDSLSTEQLQETQNINRSLLVLGNCISALGDSKKKNGHIPYRDSKLTKLLADSLGGNGVTLMIACVSPSQSSATETMSTLRYSNRAKNIQNRPTVKADPKEEMIRTLKSEIRRLRQENKYLRDNVALADPALFNSTDPLPPIKSSNSVSSDFPPRPSASFPIDSGGASAAWPESPANPASFPSSAVVDNTLYQMLQEYMTENESLRSENSDLQKGRNLVKREQQNLLRENELLSMQLKKLKRRLDLNNRSDIYSKQRYNYGGSNNKNKNKNGAKGSYRAGNQPAPALPSALPPAPQVQLGFLPGAGSPPPVQPSPQSQHSSSRSYRDMASHVPAAGETTYSHLFEGRRQGAAAGVSPRPRNGHSPPVRLSPIPGGNNYASNKSKSTDLREMNKSLSRELEALDRTIMQHQRMNAFNEEIKYVGGGRKL